MQTSAIEETVLIENSNEQEQQPETTAVVTTEPEVIDGEVIVIEQPEPSEDQVPPRQKPYWLLIPLTICFCFVFVVASFLVPVLSPSATITIIPIERTITTTTVFQVQTRQIAPLTLSQSATVAATGKRHQNAARAEGTLTFYNGLLTSQTIAGGTVLTGQDGTQVVTDNVATIPAAKPPQEGQVTVPAHAITTGEQGNIPAYDINQACCAMSVLAMNTTAFSGGRSARAYNIVTKSDIASAEATLSGSLTTSEQAAVTAQVHPDEALLTMPCSPHSISDHRPGEEATQVTVTVFEICRGIAYFAHDVYANATQMLTTEASKRFGTGYSAIGDIQTTIVPATAPSIHQGKAQIIVQVTGTWAYQITPRIQEQLTALVAGKSQQQAEALLLQVSGIAGVTISLRGGNHTLPQDAHALRILVQYNSD